MESKGQEGSHGVAEVSHVAGIDHDKMIFFRMQSVAELMKHAEDMCVFFGFYDVEHFIRDDDFVLWKECGDLLISLAVERIGCDIDADELISLVMEHFKSREESLGIRII